MEVERGSSRIGQLTKEGMAMALEVKLLDLIDIELDSSFLVLARNMGQRALAKTWGTLILGGDDRFSSTAAPLTRRSCSASA